MSTEWIDVVDTAVKIGLGALISAIATHQANRYLHAKAKEGEKRELVKSMLLSAVENADKYFFYLSQYYSRFDGLKRLRKKSASEPNFYSLVKEHLEESENGLAEARNCMHTAQSSLQLLGNVSASTALSKIRALESGLRDWYLDLPESEALPPEEILVQWKKNFNESKRKFRESTSNEFREKFL